MLVRILTADQSFVTDLPTLPRIGEGVNIELKPHRVLDIVWDVSPIAGGGYSVTVSLLPA